MRTETPKPKKQRKLTMAEVIALGKAASNMQAEIVKAHSWSQVATMLEAATGLGDLTVSNVTKVVHGAGIDLKFRGGVKPEGGTMAERVRSLEERVRLIEECLGGTGTRD